MTKLILISRGRTTSVSLASQLEKNFGNYVKVEGYCLEDDLNFDVTGSIIVLSSSEIIDKRIKNMIKNCTDYVVARRVINHKNISELLNLPKGTEVLLINDKARPAYEAIAQLQALGINHIKYYPYFPGGMTYPQIDIAVTVGEPKLVPHGFNRVIDIGTRQIDITTLSDIAEKLELMDKLGDRLSSKYIQDIIELLKTINDSAKNIRIISNRLETVANCISKAIMYVDKNREIIVCNKEMYNLLEIQDKEIIGKNIKDVLPEIATKNNSDNVDIILIRGKKVFVTANIIRGKGSEDGIIYTFEETEQIEKNEHEIRRRTTKAIRKNYYTFDDIICESKTMSRLIDKVKIFANTDSTILIQGESGTGKELFAQAIHSASKRVSEPFVPMNFPAVPMNLIESELFGYEEGSFTGATKGGKRGLFEEAHRGTIFLDEIGDAPLEFQCTLLRVIQERRVRRIGAFKEIPIDVRIIAASNKDLVEEIKKGNFRSDLYYRLNVLPIRIPSLRERRVDILPLTKFFLNKYSKGRITSVEEILDQDAINTLYSYNWPGNVRQLENAMEYIVCLWRGGKKLNKMDLPDYIIDSFKEVDDSILVDILGKDMLWVLKKLMNSNGLGRRCLAEYAKEEGIQLTEGRIRGLLEDAQSLGFVEPNTGRKGSVLTRKGYSILSKR